MLPLFFSASFTSKSIKIDSEIIQFQIWDTAGQEKVFRCLLVYALLPVILLKV